jgi:ribonuclease HI
MHQQEKYLDTIRIYTDGGCSGNPGPGAWAYIIIDGENRRQDSGSDPDTTNNRMELRAVIEALKRIKGEAAAAGRGLELYTDSRYVQQGISDWILRWEQNGWRTRAKKPVKNRELWQELRSLSRDLQVTWRWLAGHAGHALNEECDRLVGEAMRRAGE